MLFLPVLFTLCLFPPANIRHVSVNGALSTTCWTKSVRSDGRVLQGQLFHLVGRSVCAGLGHGGGGGRAPDVSELRAGRVPKPESSATQCLSLHSALRATATTVECHSWQIAVPEYGGCQLGCIYAKYAFICKLPNNGNLDGSDTRSPVVGKGGRCLLVLGWSRQQGPFSTFIWDPFAVFLFNRAHSVVER